MKTKLIIFACILITVRYLNIPTNDDFLGKLSSQKNVILTGVVIDEPSIRTTSARFTIKIQGKHKLLVKINNMSVRYGDLIEVRGSLKKPERIVNEDGRTFDYASYLMKDGIFYTISVMDVKILSSGNGNKIISWLYEFKQSFISQINHVLPSPHSFLASGLVISGKGSLDKKLQEDFQRVGLIHIVVLSGFNISIIGEAIVRLFSFLPQVFGAVCGGIGIILFSIMTGGGSTVIRSAIMSLIGLYARISGRTNSALTSLIVAGALMLIWNPLLAVYDPSFQLSFAATLGLIIYAEHIERYLTRFLNLPKSLLSLVSSTLATQIFTMPLIMKMSGVLSLVALPVNILVLPFIPFTMFFVAVSGVVSFTLPMLATLPAFVSYLLLSYELWVVSISSTLSYAAIKLPPVPLSFVVVSYILLLFIGRSINRDRSKYLEEAYPGGTPILRKIQDEKTPP